MKQNTTRESGSINLTIVQKKILFVLEHSTFGEVTFSYINMINIRRMIKTLKFCSEKTFAN